MRSDNTYEGIRQWVNNILSPALSDMPGCSIKSLAYIDGEDKQVIKVTYDDGYSREVNVTADSAKACLYDLVYSHTLE